MALQGPLATIIRGILRCLETSESKPDICHKVLLHRREQLHPECRGIWAEDRSTTSIEIIAVQNWLHNQRLFRDNT